MKPNPGRSYLEARPDGWLSYFLIISPLIFCIVCAAMAAGVDHSPCLRRKSGGFSWRRMTRGIASSHRRAMFIGAMGRIRGSSLSITHFLLFWDRLPHFSLLDENVEELVRPHEHFQPLHHCGRSRPSCSWRRS